MLFLPSIRTVTTRLVSYGYDLLDNYRRAAIYADRILRGTKPSELPVKVQSVWVIHVSKVLQCDFRYLSAAEKIF